MTPDEMRYKANVLLELVCDLEEGDRGTDSLEIAAAIWGVGAEVVGALGHKPALCGVQCGDAVGSILDEMIEHWRREVQTGAGVMADYYIDALQSARKNLIGKEKP